MRQCPACPVAAMLVGFTLFQGCASQTILIFWEEALTWCSQSLESLPGILEQSGQQFNLRIEDAVLALMSRTARSILVVLRSLIAIQWYWGSFGAES